MRHRLVLSQILLLLSLLFLLVHPALGQPLGSQFQVNTYTTGVQTAPSVSRNADRFIVVWESQDGQDGDAGGIFGQLFNGDGTLNGTEFQVNTYTTATQRIPQVSMNASGEFVVVWQLNDGDDAAVWARRFDSSGTGQGDDFQVSNATFSYGDPRPTIALQDSGEFVIAWSEYDGIILEYPLARFYANDGSPQGDSFSLGVLGRIDRIQPKIDSEGNFLVVWNGRDKKLEVRRFDPDGVTLQEETVDSSQEFRQIAMAPQANEGFATVFEDFVGNYKDIYLERFDSEALSIDDRIQVNTYTTDSQTLPTLASDASGNLIATWTSSEDGDGDSVHGQRLSSNGGPWGDVFQVNTYTTGSQDLSAVATAPNGAFVVAWAGPEIEAQRFEPLSTAITDVSISKTDDLLEARPGDQVTYTILVRNLGIVPLIGIPVEDSFPAELESCSWTSVADGATGNSNGSGDLLFDMLDLPVPSSVTYTVNCTIALDALTLSNTATVDVMDDAALQDNSATDDDTVLLVADLKAEQTLISADPIATGASFRYTLAATNAGPLAAPSVTLTNTLPEGVALVDIEDTSTGWNCQEGPPIVCNRTTLEVGTSPEITLFVTAPLTEGMISNTVSVSSTHFDPNLADNDSVLDTSVIFGLFFDDFELGDTSAWSRSRP